MTRYRPILTAISLALVLGLFVMALVRDLSGPARSGPYPVSSGPASAPAASSDVKSEPSPSPLAAVFAPRPLAGVVYADLDVPVPGAAPAKGAPTTSGKPSKSPAPSPGNG